MKAVRETIPGADSWMTETVKWDGQTFMYQGNLVANNPREVDEPVLSDRFSYQDRRGIPESNAAQVRTIKFTEGGYDDEAERGDGFYCWAGQTSERNRLAARDPTDRTTGSRSFCRCDGRRLVAISTNSNTRTV